MSRTLVALFIAVALFGCGGASTPEELGEDTLGYLADSDFNGYIADTVITPEQMLALCPNIKQFSVDQSAYNKRFVECLGKTDFPSAEVVSITPKTRGVIATNDPECGGAEAVEFADNIMVTVKSNTGIFTFDIDKAVKTADGWRATGRLDCD